MLVCTAAAWARVAAKGSLRLTIAFASATVGIEVEPEELVASVEYSWLPSSDAP